VRVAYLHGFAGDPTAWQPVLAELPDHDARPIALPGHLVCSIYLAFV
jgi:hypothetical protein